MIGGILCGLGAAAAQDSGFFFSGAFVKQGGKPEKLIAISQLFLGGAGLLSLPLLCLFSGIPPEERFWLPLLGVIIGSGGGQLMLFRAQLSMDPAAVATLMGLRVVDAALLLWLMGMDHFSSGQWIAVAMAALSAPLMNFPGGKMRGLGAMAGALAFYALSDLCIVSMIRGFGFLSVLPGAFWSMALMNFFSGVLLLPLSLQDFRKEDFFRALPFSAVWGLKQILLYFCYALIGPVHGNVVLAFRGPMAVMMEWFSRSGTADVSPLRCIRQGGAAVLMTAAVICYTLG